MSKVPFISALAFSVLLLPGHGQAPKITDGDLFKNLDAINADPVAAKPANPAADTPPAAKKADQTEITANNADFNNRTHVAIFTGDVLVRNPEFNVNCDKLTAYLKHDDKPAVAVPPGKPGAAPVLAKPTPTPPPAAGAKAGKSGGLQKAVCEMNGDGKVVVTQEKKETDGSTTNTIGKGTKVVYDAVTGDVTLTGWPEVKQGMSSSIATEEGTIMILNREGKMRAIGRTKSLVQDSGSDKPAK